MATAAKTGPQDMPPPGGYAPFEYKRIKLKTVFGVKTTLALGVASTIIGTIGYAYAYKKTKREEIEMRSARFALAPLMIAERDRAFLKQVRENREIERELMKNDPEWEVGTYYREPVYRTMPDRFHEPSYFEFMAHADTADINYRVLRRHFT